MKYKNKLIYSFLLILIFVTDGYSGTKFPFDYDYAFFRADNDSKVFFEFYYSFYQDQLIFTKTADGYEASGLIQLNISDSLKNSVIQKNYRVPINIPDTSGYNKNAKLTGQMNFLLDTGNYIIYLKASDYSDTNNNVTFEERFHAGSFDTRNIRFSTLQFASSVNKSNDEKNIFYKNTLEVIPNPSRLFGNNLNKLYYYVEIYNLKPEIISGDYSVAVSVMDLNDNELKNQNKYYKLKNESKVEYGEFDITDLKTGIYKLKFSLNDVNKSTKAEQLKQFLIFNTDTLTKQVDDGAYLLSEYPKYTEEKLNKEFAQLTYLMREDLRKQFNKLNSLDDKKKFLYNFWKKVESANTGINKKEYFERVAYANKNYKSDLLEGWQTDRGRVYITYSKPDEIDRFPFEASTRAYETWTYNNLEGGAQFVFIDLSSGSSNFVLVHSTARNELRDDNWKTKLDIHK